jgi:hypothetical protein
LIAHPRLGIGADPYPWLVVKKLLPPASVGTLSGRLEIKSRDVILRCSMTLDGKNSCPLADLLAGENISITDLTAVANDTPLALSVRLGQGSKSISGGLSAVDAFIKATGTLGPTASEIVRELEDRKLVAAAIVGQLDRITLTMPPFSKWPKAALPVPTIVLHGRSSEAVDALEAAIPAVLEMLGGGKGDGVTENVNGVKVRSFDAKASPTDTPIHIGRTGKSLAIGLDRKFLAACLIADRSRPDSTLAETAGTFKPEEGAAAAGVLNWGDMFRGVKTDDNSLSGKPQKTIIYEADGPVNGFGGYSPFGPASGRAMPPRELFGQFQNMPPLVVTLGRHGDELRFELRQSDPRNARIKTVNRLFDWFARSRGMYIDGFPYALDDVSGLMAPPPPLPGP